MTTTYTVTGLSDSKCTAQGSDLSGSAVITINPRPTAAVSGSAVICNGASASISAALTGTGPWNVTWSDGVTQTGVSASPATRTVSPSATTAYTVMGLSDSKCTAQASDLTGSAVVTVNSRPTSAASGTTTICNGGAATISAALTGTGPWNVTWSDGVTQSGILSSPAARSVSPSVTTTYTITALADSKCSGLAADRTGSAVVTVNPRPASVVSGTGPLCNGSSATISAALSGTGPWNVTWSDGVAQTGVSASPATRAVSPSVTTTYTVTGLSDSKCTAQGGDLSGSAVITISPRPTAAVSGSATICNGASASISAALTGTGPWNVTWSDGVTQTGVSASPATRSVTPSATTAYTVTGLSDSKCTAQASDLTGSAVVTIGSNPTFSISGSSVVCPSGTC